MDIDRAKGLGILLVVFGHLVPSHSIGEEMWYAFLRGKIVYHFHMPFFMYLSGFFFFFTGGHLALEKGYARFAAIRLDRLMVPFVIFGLIVILGKYFAAQFGPVNDAVDNVGNGIWGAISNTDDNPVISIWYLLILCVYSLAMPFIWRLSRGHLFALIAIAFVLYFVPFTERFYLARIAHYLLFFLIGGAVALQRDRVSEIMKRYALAFVAVFVAALIITAQWPVEQALLICGLLSIPALHGVMLQPFLQKDGILLLLGKYSMAIYLLNSIVIGVAKIIWVKFLPYAGGWNFAFLAGLLAAGTLVPMIARAVLDRIPPLDPVARYLR